MPGSGRPIPQTVAPRPAQGQFGTVDPAPPSSITDTGQLRRIILDPSRTLWERYKALFGLRNKNDDEAAVALGEALLTDQSALLRHECAYVLGQMQREISIPYLVKSLKDDPNSMVRHESAEALGGIGTDAVVAPLEEALVNDTAVVVRESCELALKHFEYLKDRSRLDP